MKLRMFFKHSIGDKTFAACIANPGFVSRMSQKVGLQVNFLDEAFATKLADMWPVVCMYLGMFS